MKERQEERGVSDSLVREVVADGLILDQLGSATLHVSDHIIVISSKQNIGVTTYRHPLLGEWRAGRSSPIENDGVKILDTSYFFFQVTPILFVISCL